MTPDQQQQLIVISEKFGVDDYELFYIGAMALVDLVATTVAYVLIMKLWRLFKVRYQSD